MADRSLWGMRPRDSIEDLCRRLGDDTVIRDCLVLLSGGDADPSVVDALAGPAAVRFLDAPAQQRYWLRVWGARGLLWAPWRPSSTAGVRSGLADGHWRVREMSAKVVARHRVDDALPQIAALAREDPVERVRVAAARALRLLTAPADPGRARPS